MQLLYNLQSTPLVILGYTHVATADHVTRFSMCVRDERSYIFQTPTPLLLLALRFLLRLQKIWKHQLQLLLTLLKFLSNSYQKDSVYFAS